MKKSVVVLIALVVSAASGCGIAPHARNPPLDTVCSDNETAKMDAQKDERHRMSEAISPRFVSRVAYIDDMTRGPTLPVDVSFYDHAAVFDLERDHPCFLAWLSMLKKSEEDGRAIVFTHTWVGMRIRSVELGDQIIGVVEEIFEISRWGSKMGLARRSCDPGGATRGP